MSPEPEENRCTCCPVHGHGGRQHWPVYVPVPAQPGYGPGWWWSPVPPFPWYHPLPVTYTISSGSTTFTSIESAS